MQAALLREYHRPLQLEEIPDPVPGPGRVAVEVRAAGVCGSDVFLQKGGFDSTLPIVPGHEAAGVVSEVGPGVEIKPGTPVAMYYIDHCGECRICRAGRVNMCLSVRRMGVATASVSTAMAAGSSAGETGMTLRSATTVFSANAP